MAHCLEFAGLQVPLLEQFGRTPLQLAIALAQRVELLLTFQQFPAMRFGLAGGLAAQLLDLPLELASGGDLGSCAEPCVN